MMVKPFAGKAKIKNTYSGYKIEIPAPRNWFVILFMSAWMGGWTMGWIFAFSSVIDGIFSGGGGFELFIAFWLIGWTVAGVFVIKTLFWMIFGKEIITISDNKLQIERRGDLLSKTKMYDLTSATNFQIKQSPQFNAFSRSHVNSPFFPGKMGTIQFDYGLKTISFGIGIDEAEGRYLLEMFSSKRLIVS